MNHITILSFDVSSSCVGFAVLKNNDNNIEYVDAGYFLPLKNNLFESLKRVKLIVSQLIIKYRPDYVAIEDIIKFMNKHSSANTITKLAIYNRIIGLQCYELMNKEPLLCNVMSIRASLKKHSNLNKSPSKEDVPMIIEKLLCITFPWQLNKKGKILKQSFDVSDAIACGYYALKSKI